MQYITVLSGAENMRTGGNYPSILQGEGAKPPTFYPLLYIAAN